MSGRPGPTAGAERRAGDPRADGRVAALAGRQGGLVSRRRLLALGLGPSVIDHELRRRRLLRHPMFCGVYAVGHAAPGPGTTLWAGHLAAGPASVVGYRSAAIAHDLVADGGGQVHVLLPHGPQRRRGLHVHRTRRLPPEDVVAPRGLPVTSVPRTLVDLAATASPRTVERAYDRAEVLRTLDHAAVEAVLASAPNRPGTRVLRRIVARDRPGSTVTESPREEDLLAIVREAGLPEPVLQHRVLEYRADCAWPHARLMAEADGGHHGTPSGREHDTERDARLAVAGWLVLRFTGAQIRGRPRYVAEQLAAALRARTA